MKGEAMYKSIMRSCRAAAIALIVVCDSILRALHQAYFDHIVATFTSHSLTTICAGDSPVPESNGHPAVWQHHAA